MEGQQALQAGVIEVAVAAGLGVERRQAAGIPLQLAPQGSGIVATAVLQQPQGQGNNGGALAAHVHQVAPHHAIAIERHVVVGLPFGRGAGNRSDPVDHTEHGDQGARSGGQPAQRLPALPHPQVAVEVEADRPHPGGLQPADRRHQVAVIEGPAQAAQVLLVDGHDPDRQPGRRGEGPQPQGQVVEAQVQRLRQPPLVQHQQHQHRQGIGEEAAQKR